MEDDDETQSQLSRGSQSPASPTPAGRITVTVAATATTTTPVTPQQQRSPSPTLALPPPHNALTLALPIQQVRNGGGREDCWSEAATAVLIEAWGERYLELSRGNLKQKHWKEVADIVNSREDHRKTPKTDIQCKNRVDTVKKKYKLEKAKVASGAGPSKWPLYNKLDHLVGPTSKTPSSATAAASSKVPVGIPIPGRGSMFLKNHPINSNNNNIHIKRRVPPFASHPPEVYDHDNDNTDDSSASLGSTDSEGFVSKRPRMNVNLDMNRRMSMNTNTSTSTAKKSKKKRVTGSGSGSGSNSGWGGAVRELTSAIMKFSEAYEKAESLKIQQVVEMEKQRMKFAKDLELQRMHFFMKTQVEISQLKHHGVGNGGNGNGNGGGTGSTGGSGSRRGVGIGNPSNIYHNNNNNSNNNSDSSN